MKAGDVDPGTKIYWTKSGVARAGVVADYQLPNRPVVRVLVGTIIFVIGRDQEVTEC